MAYVSVSSQVFVFLWEYSEYYIYRCGGRMFVLISCPCLSEASEKMLKAWQENEERAAAFAEVTHA